MKKLFLSLTFIFISYLSFCQQIIKLKEPKSTIKTDRAPQLLYAGLGGPGIALSINYDRRFNKQVDGFGFNVGIGTSLSDNGLSYKTIPFGINLLLGNAKRGRYFEVGATQTVLLTSEYKNNSFFNYNYILVNNILEPNKTYTFTNIIIGYRSQPSEGGFNFRGGINPIFFKNDLGLGAYLSFGYNF